MCQCPSGSPSDELRQCADNDTKLGRAVSAANTNVQTAFVKNSSWTAQIKIRNANAHPVWHALLVQLLELDQKGVPLAAEAIVFLLLGTRQLQLDGKRKLGVADLIEDVINDFPGLLTQEQEKWIRGLDLGV